ncbi:helix-turn-helix domain-containing protein [Pediococcus inopinatus]|uniref:DNA-binding protein n=1 Tax=Pediococcus inopinatus TaxID=114090 RepID=UPI002B25A6B5|nr:DNA-binding protein [Pediococcus inopinatus]WPC18330.1 helix-turn-helix domain-containing protein [Pediococcus inopinatus]
MKQPIKLVLTDEQLKNLLDNIATVIISKLSDQLSNKLAAHYYMNKKEAAKFIGISTNTLDNWILQGLKVSTIDGIICIDPDDIHDFLLKYQN